MNPIVTVLEKMMPNDKVAPVAGAVSRNSATGELIKTWPFQTDRQVERTLALGSAAPKEWRATPIAARVDCYRRLAAALRDRSDALAAPITAEMGKTIGGARAEVEKSATLLDWLVAQGPAVLADEPAEAKNEAQAYVSFLPIGTIVGVMPWNLPIWQSCAR